MVLHPPEGLLGPPESSTSLDLDPRGPSCSRQASVDKAASSDGAQQLPNNYLFNSQLTTLQHHVHITCTAWPAR